LVLGCHGVQPFEPPPPPGDDVRSAIVVFESDELDVFALDLGESDPLTRPFAADGDAIITLLYLPHDLTSMRLSPGRIEPSAAPPDRLLPSFLRAYRSNGAEVLGWDELEVLPDALAAFRLPGFEVEECATLGGCYLDPDQAQLEHCTLPCPTDAPLPPMPPEPPLSPSFEPCPPGWMPRTIETVVVCEPSASLCPAGMYREDLPAGAIRVDTGQSLAAAIANASGGDVIALSKGTHAGAIVDRALTIIGACASETIVEAPLDGVGLSVQASLSLEDLTVRGGLAAIEATAGAHSFSRVVLEQSTHGLWMASSSLTGRDLTVRDVEWGLVLGAAEASLERVSVERCGSSALEIDSSTVTATDVVVRDASTGISLGDSTLTVARAAFFDMFRVAVSAFGRSRLDADDLAIARSTAPGYSYGLVLQGTTQAEVARFAASDIDGEGIHATHDVVATIDDVRIERDGATPSSLGTQCGFNVFGKAHVTTNRVHLEALHRQGICSYAESDVIVRDLTAIEVGDHAVYVFDDGTMSVTRANLRGAADGAVAFLRTSLTMEDVMISGMHGDVRYVPTTMLGYPRGRGLYNNAMSRLNVERFTVSGCEDAGMDLGSDESALLRNGVVTGNQIGARLTFEPKILLRLVQVSDNRLNFASE
jgi:hypothetical protein